jgi:hypothetical protein
MSISATAFAALACAAMPSSAAAQQTMDIDPGVPMFCRDSSGEYQPFVRTNLGRMKESFRQQLGFGSTLVARSPSTGTLTFRGGEKNAERITYTVEVHEGGIALVDMKVRLSGASEDLTGSKMCWQTWSIVNVK